MKRTRSISFLFGVLSLVSAAQAQAQPGEILVTLAGSWVVSQPNNNNFSNDDHVLTIPGAGSDTVTISSLSNTQRALGNQTQSEVVGFRTGSIAMSGSNAASTFGSMVFFWNGPGSGNATVSASCDATGHVPQLSNINMSGSAQVTFTAGNFGAPPPPPPAATTSTATVTAPSVSTGGPGALGSVNRVVLSQGTPISQTFAGTTAFFYSCAGNASTNATLKRGDNADLHTSVVTTATITLF
jgi:hypothetical protein